MNPTGPIGNKADEVASSRNRTNGLFEVNMQSRWLPFSRALVIGARCFLVMLAGPALLITGCSTNLSRTPAPNATLQSYKTFYIVQSETDNRGLSTLIQNELALLGKSAKSGPRTSIPNDVDAIVTYYEDWKWDLTWYLLNLLVQFRDPKTNVLLGSAASYRTSLARIEPALMTREVLEAILK